MDPASWANDRTTIDDGSEYDNDPEMSGYQTLPEIDTKDDSEQETSPVSSPVSTSANTPAISQILSEPNATLNNALSGQKDKSDQGDSGIKEASLGGGSASLSTSAAPGTVSGMKPNALAILQGIESTSNCVAIQRRLLNPVPCY